MEIHQKSNQYESKDLSIILWIVLMLVFSLGIILEGYSDKPETRKIHHLNSFRGHLIQDKPVSINEHCL